MQIFVYENNSLATDAVKYIGILVTNHFKHLIGIGNLEYALVEQPNHLLHSYESGSPELIWASYQRFFSGSLGQHNTTQSSLHILPLLRHQSIEHVRELCQQHTLRDTYYIAKALDSEPCVAARPRPGK